MTEIDQLKDQVRILSHKVQELGKQNQTLHEFIHRMNPVGRCKACGHDMKDKQRWTFEIIEDES